MDVWIDVGQGLSSQPLAVSQLMKENEVRKVHGQLSHPLCYIQFTFMMHAQLQCIHM